MKDYLFKDFDIKVLDDPDYKEDAVREDIVTPILKKLGYSPSGDNRMLRTKALTHPFVYIGTQKRKINIIPDYIMQVKNECVLTLDAKAPKEDILKGKNVEQAYSYAIHRDVRTFYYGLCNGREIAIFQITKYEPILHIPFLEIDKRWEELSNVISPMALTNPDLIGFQPDFGLTMHRFGSPDTQFIFVGAWISFISKVSDDLYSLVSSVSFNEDKFAASFDFPKAKFDEFINCVPVSLKEKIKRALTQQPYQIYLDESAFEIVIDAHLGKTVEYNDYEDYLPLIVDNFSSISTGIKTQSNL